MYNELSKDYDRFVNWNSRLAYELPFIQKQIKTLQQGSKVPLKILDAAGGTGMHAIALAKSGHIISSADLFPEMISIARENAQNADVHVDFKVAGFGELANAFGKGRFDLVLCLGNSLPHLLNLDETISALMDFAACLRPGGILLIQNRNFDSIMKSRQRWMEPQTHQDETGEYIFQRFYDFETAGLIRFNIVTLKRLPGSAWQANVSSTFLRPQPHDELIGLLVSSGFDRILAFGSMEGESFIPETSANLILTAQSQGKKES